MRMTDKKLVAFYKRRKEIKKESDGIEGKIKKLMDKEDELNEILGCIEEVDEIYKNIPLSIFNNGIQKAADDWNAKRATVFKDVPFQHWIVKMDFANRSRPVEVPGFKTQKVAMEAAKEWICFNKKPKPV